MPDQRTCPECGAVLPPEAAAGQCINCMLKLGLEPIDSLPLGAKVHYFGDYELREKIGRGAKGVVYKARQISLNRLVALKMISSGRLADETEVKRFRLEAEAAGSLDHPNIVPIYEVGEHAGQHYYSMRLVEGGSLAQQFDRYRRDHRAAAQVLATAARAVHHAHQRGILHRDLKPGNVLIDARDQPHIADFGLAKLIEQDESLTQADAVMGTPAYMAPEQAAGQSKQATTAADVYSLGAILYMMLTGRPPFQEADPLQTLRQVVEAEPVRPRAINPKADRDLETICLKCLEKDPDDRYGSAEDLAEELDCWLRGEPIAARPSHAAERIVKWAKRKPAVAALILAIIITISGAVAAVFGGILWHNKRLSDRLWRGLLDQARAERLALQPRRAVELLGEAAQIKRDPALRQEAIQAIAQPGMRLVHNLPFGRVFAVKFSPDGQMLAAGGWLMPTTGWKPRFAKGLVVWKWPSAEPLNEFAWDTQGPFAFSPVTPILAVPETNGTVTLRNPYTGVALRRVSGRGALLFSPDGTRLVIAAGASMGKGIRVVNVNTGSEEGVRPNARLIAFISDDELLLRAEKQILKWNLVSDQETILTPSDAHPLAVSFDGRIAVIRAGHLRQPKDSLQLWDLVSNRAIASFAGFRSNTVAARLSRDGQLLACDDVESGSIKIWDIAAEKFHPFFSKGKVWLRPTEGIRQQQWFIGTNHNLQRGEASFEMDVCSPLAPHTGDFHPNGLFFSAAVPSLLSPMAWEVETGHEISSHKIRAGGAGVPAWSPDGRWLVSVDYGWVASGPVSETNMSSPGLGWIKAWETTWGVVTYEFGEPIQFLAFSPNGAQLAVNTTLAESRNAEQLIFPSLKLKRPPKVLAPFVTRRSRLWFCENGNVLASETALGEIPHIRDAAELRQVAPEEKDLIQVRTGTIHASAVNSDGTRLLLACTPPQARDAKTPPPHRSSECQFELWDLTSARQLAVWKHESPLFHGSVAFTPDGKHFVSVVLDWTIEARGVWRIETFNATNGHRQNQIEIPSFHRDQLGVLSFLLSADGQYGIGISRMGVVTVHRMGLEESVAMWNANIGTVGAAALSPTGRVLALGSVDGLVHLRDLLSGRELARWQAHDIEVTGLTFNLDGTTLVSGNSQGTLKLWNLQFIRRELAALGLDWQSSP